MTTKEQKSYAAQAKRDALVLAKEVGLREAARRLGIPAGTLSYWGFKARKAATAGEPWPKVPEPNDSGGDEEVEGTTADGEERAAASHKKARVARVYTPSQRAEALELASKVGVTAASRQLGLSRWSIYDWQRRAALAARGEGPSPTSGPDPADLEAQRDREVLSMWHKHPGLGPSQIGNQLRRASIKIATNTVRRVMEEAGYRPPKVRRRKHDERFEAVRCNHIWLMASPALCGVCGSPWFCLPVGPASTAFPREDHCA